MNDYAWIPAGSYCLERRKDHFMYHLVRVDWCIIPAQLTNLLFFKYHPSDSRMFYVDRAGIQLESPLDVELVTLTYTKDNLRTILAASRP